MSADFFDIQVNGYGGIDFNQNDLSAEDLHKACAKTLEDGTNGILATIITADIQDMTTRLKRIVQIREEDELVRNVISGIHIEGPFISPQDGYRGAHPAECIKDANLDEMKTLLDAAGGLTRIVTLAPEADKNFEVTSMLNSEGIVVSAGHTDATLDQLKGAVDNGLSMFTHLGNGCAQYIDRRDNIIQRVLSLHDNLTTCFIADGMHIPFYILRNYLDITGYEKTVIVSDAMSAAGAKPGKYTISNLTIEVGEDGIVREPGKDNFAGSSITMKKSFDNLINALGLTEEQALKLTKTNPMKAIGLI